MDWAAFFSLAKDVALGGAAVTTAVVAVRGFANWNRELHGRATFETARAMARATYALRNAIEQSRAPWMDGSEFPPEYHAARATSSDRAAGYAYLFQNRLKPVYAAAEAFDAQTLEAEALWGPALKAAANELRRQPVFLRSAFMAIIDNARDDGSHFAADQAFKRKMHAMAWGVPDDADNEFSISLCAAVSGIEAILKPHLRTEERRSFFERLGARL